MDSECAICYCEQATCKLVCNHSFCKSCVKSWYEKSDEPTCPMCRRRLYFKGLHRVSQKWEEERNDKINEESFKDAFDSIFEESEYDEESDGDEEDDSEDGDSVWETDSEDEHETVPVPPAAVQTTEPESAWEDDWNSDSVTSEKFSKYWSDDILEDIKDLEKQYKKAMNFGVTLEEYYDNIDYFEMIEKTMSWVLYSVFAHEKNLFVSNHKNMIQNKRTGSRIPSRNYMGFIVVFLLVV